MTGGLTTASRTTAGFAAGTYISVHFFISTGSYIYIKIWTIGENKNKHRAFLFFVIIWKIIFHVFVDVMNFQDSIKLFLKSRACKIFIIIDTSYLPCNTFILTYFTMSTCTVIIYMLRDSQRSKILTKTRYCINVQNI